jgi:hypothetical protein
LELAVGSAAGMHDVFSARTLTYAGPFECDMAHESACAATGHVGSAERRWLFLWHLFPKMVNWHGEPPRAAT